MECINKKYPLGPKCHNVVLNYREATCMRYLLKKFTLQQIAREMHLSPRTVGFYIGSVMLQLKCDDIPKLLDCIKQSDLLRYFEMKDRL